MSESDYFAVACAIAVMQAVEGGLLLARQGRIRTAMYLSSAVELAWLAVTIVAIRGDWLSEGRTFWAWAFIGYYAAYACAGYFFLSDEDDGDTDAMDLRERLTSQRIPVPLVILSIVFAIAYGIGSFLELRAL